MPRRTSTNNKPLAALRQFARQLGWLGLGMWQAEFDGRVITWYKAGKSDGSRNDFFLQINECPLGQTITCTAAVYAIRYTICTGWHSMHLAPDGTCDESEVARLDTWLNRRWFETPRHRREFRRLHPECAGWSWARISREHLAYEVVDAENGITARTG